MQKIFIGIDPGLSGGISIINQFNEINVCIPMPVIGDNKSKKEIDIGYIIDLIKQYQKDNKIIHVGIEKVSAMPKQGVSSMFRFGTGWGKIIGIIHTLGLPYSLIRPQQWQKEIFEGYNKKDTKQISALVCSRLFPNYDFRKSERSKKFHDGMTDATCIALYVKKHFL